MSELKSYQDPPYHVVTNDEHIKELGDKLALGFGKSLVEYFKDNWENSLNGSSSEEEGAIRQRLLDLIQLAEMDFDYELNVMCKQHPITD